MFADFIMTDDSENVRLNRQISALEQRISELRDENDLLKIELKDISSSLDRYKLIADFAHDWEMWYRPDREIEYISPSVQNITGYTPDELISQPGLLNQVIFPEDLQKYNDYISAAVGLINIRQSLSFRILTRTKQVRWCEIKSRAVYDRRGKYLGQRASVNDVTRLMQALGEIRSLSDGKQMEVRAKEKYLRDIESKDRELFSYLMSISQKNETLQYIRNNLRKMKSLAADRDASLFEQMISHIDSSLFSTETWDNFRLHFEKLHPGFFERLTAQFPGLTSKDMKLCAYLRLQLATKEIAVLLNITPQSAEISRVRLRKKMNLQRKVSLTDYISRI